MSYLKLFLITSFTLLLASCENSTQLMIPTLTADQLKTLIEINSDTLILDVRTLDEYDLGHIPTAVSLHVDELEERIFDIAPTKHQHIVLYCFNGNRSKKAYDILHQLGYTHVDYFGSIANWPYPLVFSNSSTSLK